MRNINHQIHAANYDSYYKYSFTKEQRELYRGVIQNNPEVIRDTLDKSRDRASLVNSNLGGGTHYVAFRAIHWAAANGHLEAILELKKHPVDLSQRAAGSLLQKIGGVLALETAAYRLWDSGDPRRKAVLKELRLKPQEIKSGAELLYLGAITDDEEYIKEALKRPGVDINVNLGNFKDTQFTALHWAAKYGSQAAIDLLVEKKADTTLKTDDGLLYQQVQAEYSNVSEHKLAPVARIIEQALIDTGIGGYGVKDCILIACDLSISAGKELEKLHVITPVKIILRALLPRLFGKMEVPLSASTVTLMSKPSSQIIVKEQQSEISESSGCILQ